jgi:hypothetical protein
MARRRVPEPSAGPAGRSGWAHYERTAPLEVRFAEWCPDPAGPHGECKTVYEHHWHSDPVRAAGMRERMRRLG